MKQLTLLASCIIGVLVVGFIGSLFTSTSIDGWYATLQQPPLTPPNSIFGPVWTTLYVLIGVSLYLVISARSLRPKYVAYSLFAAQLGLNILWSVMFFGLQSPAWALVVILLLLFTILWYIDETRSYHRWASWLFVPYALWTAFATYLTVGIVLLN